MKVVWGCICGLVLIVGSIIFGMKWQYERKHGTPPGTYEINMEDWNE